MSIFDELTFDINIYTVDDTRKDLERVVEYFQSLPYHERAMQAFLIETRHMPESVIKDSNAFFIDEDISPATLPDWMQASSLGLVKANFIPMWGRCVFTVKSPKGSIMGFVGWDPTVKPKYLDSINYGYKAKVTSFYGMENLYRYYTSSEPVFITEGLMCTLWLRSQGFQAMASLGSHLSGYCVEILKRLGPRCVVVPDNDQAGEDYLKQVKRKLPLAQEIMVRQGKDIDGCRLDHQEDLISDLRNISNLQYANKIIIRR